MASFKNVLYYGSRLCKKAGGCKNCPLAQVATLEWCLFANASIDNASAMAEEIEDIIADDLAKELKESGIQNDRLVNYGLDGLD